MSPPAERTPRLNGNGVRVPWSVLWAAVVVAAGFATTYVYATKVELKVHADAESVVSSDLKTKAAVTEQAVQQHTKTFDRLERYMETNSRNVETLMRAVEIPERKIVKTKEE